MDWYLLPADKFIQKALRELLDNLLSNLNEVKLEEIKIAACEIVQNIVRHAYKNQPNQVVEINIEINQIEKKIKIFFRDYAKPCNNAFLDLKFKPNENGSMGLNLIRKLSSKFSIQPLENGNLTEVVFLI